jgi:hypothetical protein
LVYDSYLVLLAMTVCGALVPANLNVQQLYTTSCAHTASTAALCSVPFEIAQYMQMQCV